MDIAVGGISVTQERLGSAIRYGEKNKCKCFSFPEVVDFALPFAEENVCFVTHVPPPLPKWQAIFWPFDSFIWMFVLITLVACFVSYLLLSLMGEKIGIGHKISFSKALLHLTRIQLNQGIGLFTSPALGVKLLSGIFIMYSVIIDFGRYMTYVYILSGMSLRIILQPIQVL